ncbi:hypothetical protein NHQ30_010851 [Ciborinia camelliae]|nr:hypothetical protein NHQ30_010851 [Ciborinia camelliae]
MQRTTLYQQYVTNQDLVDLETEIFKTIYKDLEFVDSAEAIVKAGPPKLFTRHKSSPVENEPSQRISISDASDQDKTERYTEMDNLPTGPHYEETAGSYSEDIFRYVTEKATIRQAKEDREMEEDSSRRAQDVLVEQIEAGEKIMAWKKELGELDESLSFSALMNGQIMAQRRSSIMSWSGLRMNS